MLVYNNFDLTRLQVSLLPVLDNIASCMIRDLIFPFKGIHDDWYTERGILNASWPTMIFKVDLTRLSIHNV